jgi:hypothetical protein
MTLFNSYNASELIPQAGRTVTTFPSGLIRVDQSFLTESSALFTSRALVAVGNDAPGGDSSPSVDGLKIFPEAQELRREDGFTEFIVSSYGRTASPGASVLGVEVVTLNASYSFTYTPTPPEAPQTWNWSIKEEWLVDTFTTVKTMLASEANATISITPPTLSKVLKKREFSGARPGMNVPGGGVSTPGGSSIGADWESGLASIDRRNFGHFDEVVIVFKLSGTVSDNPPQ